jgi:hypothetical protein
LITGGYPGDLGQFATARRAGIEMSLDALSLLRTEIPIEVPSQLTLGQVAERV